MSIQYSDSPTPRIRLDGKGWGLAAPAILDRHVATLAAWEPADVSRVLVEAEQAAADGLHAVGFISYEAAHALNPSLPSLPSAPLLPLAWFAMFRNIIPAEPPCCSSEPLPLQPVPTGDSYSATVRKALEYIADGDCYQVNLTFPVSGGCGQPPHSLYGQLLRSQPPTYGVCIEAGPFSVLSLSPELFFSRSGEHIVTRPMKGTAVRGRYPAEDRLLMDTLRASDKERAENLMIVDLLRNDLGKAAITGSIDVPELFALESLPTVHQMTSAITARLRPGCSLLELMTALFPCGSVTGAPKRRAMEIITELEHAPRGVYCGAIGYLAPGGGATFSVAIRTLFLDHIAQTALLGVGSGITADSSPDAEFRECLAKGAFVTSPPPSVGVMESLRLEDSRYPLVERHLRRLAWSAGRLGIPFDRDEASRLLDREPRQCGIRKVRLHLAPSGALSIDSEPLAAEPDPIVVALDTGCPVDPDDLLLYLKTDRRERYREARARHPEADEVLLVNSRGELTEGSYNSVVLEIAGELLTPQLASGLLPGVFRESLLECGEIREAVLYPADLDRAEGIWLINAVRGWRRGLLNTGKAG